MHRRPALAPPRLAFPAVLINIGHGQNGLLTAALLGGALAMLDRRPIVAGILFGLLAYKPQFGLMIPLVLAASGALARFCRRRRDGRRCLPSRPRSLFGPQVWHAFLDSTALHPPGRARTGRSRLVQDAKPVRLGAHVGRADPARLRAAGRRDRRPRRRADLAMAQRGPYPLKAAALCLAAILATPYTFDYDMMVLAPAIAFFAADGCTRGFGPWEKTALAALWLMPLRRPQRRTNNADPARRAGDARAVHSVAAAQHVSFLLADGLSGTFLLK